MTHAGQSSQVRPVLLLLFFMLFFYRLGASNIEGLLNYPFWRDMGGMMSNEDFIRLRTDHLWKIYPLLVAPFGLGIVVTAVLAGLGAPPVPRWVIVAALVCQTVSATSTLLIQIPIQTQLSQTGFDPAVLDRLIVTDLLLRKLPNFVEALFVGLGLWMVIVRATTGGAASTGRRG